jgi:RNA polymerase sigma-70 factor (ECF subfamily)
MATTPNELIPTRATLIQRLKDWQDQSSWQDFFDTYWNLIYGVAVRGGLTSAEAEDVVQETIVSVAKHMPGFRYDPAIGSFKAWLLNMTRWRITDQLRKRGPQAPLPETEEETTLGYGLMHEDSGHVVPELEKLWDAEWEKNLLSMAISKVKRKLDPKHYQIFDCHVNKHLSPEQVAKAFGIPVSQVYMAKHRITEMIRLEVERLKRDVL